MHTTGYGKVACWSVTSFLPDCNIISRVAALLHGKSAAFDGDCNLAADSLAWTAVLVIVTLPLLTNFAMATCAVVGVCVSQSLTESHSVSQSLTVSHSVSQSLTVSHSVSQCLTEFLSLIL